MDNPQNYYDLLFGTTILLISIVGGLIVLNKILLYFTDNKELNFFSLLIYLLMIVLIVLFVEYVLGYIVVNQKIARAITQLTGPLIGFSSLFLEPTLRGFIKQV
jgi:predicted membrane channel-forming protein YqfA (hemolysin III family)